MHADDWLSAFVLTQAIEVPVYLHLARGLRPGLRVVYAFGASTVTHPLIWFCLPWEQQPWMALVLVAESFAIGVEALWGRCFRVPRPGRASLMANLASFGLGSVIRGVWHWWALG